MGGWLGNLLGRGEREGDGPRAPGREAIAEIERWLEVGVRRAPVETVERLRRNCEQMLREPPGHPAALEMVGDLALQADEFERCIRDYSEVLAAAPDNARAHYKLGVCLESVGRLGEAASSYRRCLEIQPGHAKALNNLGCILEHEDRVAAAEEHYRKALESDPELPQGYVNLANLLNRRGSLDEAAEKYLMAIKYFRAEQGADEQHMDALRSLGDIYLQQKRHDELELCCREAMKVKPDDVGAHFHLGNVLYARFDLDEASRSFEEALRLNPDLAGAYNNLGNIYKMKDQADEAIRCYESAIRLDPDDPDVYTNLGSLQLRVGRVEQGIALHRKALEISPDFEEGQSNLLFSLNYLYGNDPDLMFREHADWGARLTKKYLRRKVFRNPRDPGKRLRVGYVSADFRRHSVGYFILPVIQSHDRATVEIVCYANNPLTDGVTEEFQRACDVWRPIAKRSSEEVAAMILEDEIDILVDLTGYTSGYRMELFAGRAAPIQVSYLGYPNTTGLGTMDYRFTDGEADPEGLTDRYHTERLVRLPRGFLCYQPPAGSPEVGTLPQLASGLITFGSFNNYAKVAPQICELWAAVLKAVPNSRLLVKSLGLGAGDVQREIEERFAALGLEKSRIAICGADDSWQSHLARYHEVDIALDVFPYNGTTTTCEALWMGVPVISLSGRTHVSRVGRSLLTRVGLQDLAADTPEEFVSKAATLAGDVERLGALRTGLRQKLLSSPLYDATGFTRDLENAFRTMWHDWCENAEIATTSELAAESAQPGVEGVFGGDPEICVRIQGDMTITVPNSISSLTPYVLLEQEDWFEDEIGVVRRILACGMKAVDIGANYGVYTLAMARAVGNEGQIWAFEPASNTAAYLQRTLEANGCSNVQLLTVGLSDAEGSAWLKLNPNPELNEVVRAPGNPGECEAISLLSLDRSVSEFGIDGVDFIKMDAEGQETNILQGGQSALRRETPLIMFEIKHGERLNFGLVNRFREVGYQPYRLIPGLNLLAPFRVGEDIDPYQLNLFCCKADRAHRLREQGLLADRSEVAEVPTIGGVGWEAMAAGLPYARQLVSGGSRGAVGRTAGFAEYLQALDWFALAHRADAPAEIRLGALERAMEGMSVAVKNRETLARLQSYIRVAWEFGSRYVAVQGLKRLLRILSQGEETAVDEPFLAVSPRFERIAPGADLVTWIEASAIERHQKLRAFSSYFFDQGSLPALERLRSLGFMTPEMERRRQLIRLRHGFQERIEPSELLVRHTPDNLNPGLWGA